MSKGYTQAEPRTIIMTFIFRLGFALLQAVLTFATPIPSYSRTNTTGFGTITTTTNGSITRAIFNNPPINLCDERLIRDLYDFLTAIEDAPEPPKVVIFSSADDAFFMPQIDVHILSTSEPYKNATYSAELLGLDVKTVHLLRVLPTIFIGEVNGLATAAGNEFLVQCDMRFAGPRARLGALEVANGLLHGNGGAQYLTHLIGPGRALEYLLTVNDVDAKTAEQYGWVNRAYGSEAELKREVDAIAARIALWDIGAINATKASVRENDPQQAGLDRDLERFEALLGTKSTQDAIKRFLKLSQDQTRGWFELGLDESWDILL